MPGVIPEKVNPQQKKAIQHGTGPLLIIAGAGTGKTTVVTERIAELILKKNVPSENILALTFTDKAAGEMQDRIERILPYGYVDLWVMTFHSFSQRMLERHALDIGLSNDFTLLNTTEQWLLIRENLNRFDLDYYRPLGNPTKFISALVKHFSRLKDEDITPEEYSAYAKSLTKGRKKKEIPPSTLPIRPRAHGREVRTGEEELVEAQRVTEVAQAFATYNQLLLEKNSLDFGDLILYALRLFKQRPAWLKKYQTQFQHILVDEFQDTNWAQYELIKLLAAPKNNLTVVGDDDQSIYKFRGASVANILAFTKDFPDAEIVLLTQNYRNQQNILDLAHKFIQLNNPDRLEAKMSGPAGLLVQKRLKAHRTGEGVIELVHTETQAEEARAVADKIVELKNADPEKKFSDFAILVRANDHAQCFLEEFDRRGLPATFYAARGLFSKPIILDILAYLKLLDNYHEPAAAYRVLAMDIFGIPGSDAVELGAAARKHTWSLYEAMQHASEVNISPAGRRGITKILALIGQHSELARTKGVGEIVLRFLNDSGYLMAITRREDATSHEQVQLLNQFYGIVTEFQLGRYARVGEFLEYIDRVRESGDSGTLKNDIETGPDTIKILTVHGAKGLEFPYVFLVNVVEQRFPGLDRKDPIEVPDALVREVLPGGDAHVQEERRLMYVGITRARDGVFFTAAEDYGGVRRKKLSPFLYELGLLRPPVKAAARPTPLPGKKFAPSLEQQHETTAYRKREKRYSYTKLASYETCPWQYRYAFVLHVPKKGSYQLSYGQSIHRTLYSFFTLWQERQHDTTVQPPYVSAEEFMTIYDRAFIPEWYETKGDREKYYHKGKDALHEWYRRVTPNMPKVLRLEQVFNLKVDEFVVSGAIDRIDQVGGDEKSGPAGKPTVRIVDYKTGAFKPKFETGDKHQLLIYALAAQDPNILNAEVKELEYYFVDENKSNTLKPTPKDLASTKAWISKTISGIQSGDFRPTPGLHCKWCDFREICEYRAY